MPRILIIDDEANIRNMISEIVTKYCNDAVVVGQAGSVKEGHEKIRALDPDLVLLDIQMDDGTGFDLLEGLKDIRFKVIFITAFQEYAIQAIKFSALDYIMKPVDPEELIAAIKGAGEVILDDQEKQLNHLADNLHNSDQVSKKILLKTSDSIHLVRFVDIICCEADSGYTKFILHGDDSILVSKTLAEYEDLFSNFGFFRVHKSFLINLHKVIRFEREDGGTLVMEEEIKVPVASRKRDQVLMLLEKLTE